MAVQVQPQLARSKSRALTANGSPFDGLEAQYIPAPLQPRKLPGLVTQEWLENAAVTQHAKVQRKPVAETPRALISSSMDEYGSPPPAYSAIRAQSVPARKPSWEKNGVPSKWKSLGAFFGRKEDFKHPDVGYLQKSLQHDQYDHVQNRHKAADQKLKQARQQMHAQRAVPTAQSLSGAIRPTGLRRGSSKASRGRRQEISPDRRSRSLSSNQIAIRTDHVRSTRGHGEKQVHALNVDIPSVELERYSVMFSQVLKSGGAGRGASKSGRSPISPVKGGAVTLTPISENKMSGNGRRVSPKTGRSEKVKGVSPVQATKLNNMLPHAQSDVKYDFNKPLPRPVVLRAVTAPSMTSQMGAISESRAETPQEQSSRECSPFPKTYDNVPTSKYATHHRKTSSTSRDRTHKALQQDLEQVRPSADHAKIHPRGQQNHSLNDLSNPLPRLQTSSSRHPASRILEEEKGQSRSHGLTPTAGRRQADSKLQDHHASKAKSRPLLKADSRAYTQDHDLIARKSSMTNRKPVASRSLSADTTSTPAKALPLHKHAASLPLPAEKLSVLTTSDLQGKIPFHTAKVFIHTPSPKRMAQTHLFDFDLPPSSPDPPDALHSERAHSVSTESSMLLPPPLSLSSAPSKSSPLSLRLPLPPTPNTTEFDTNLVKMAASPNSTVVDESPIIPRDSAYASPVDTCGAYSPKLHVSNMIESHPPTPVLSKVARQAVVARIGDVKTVHGGGRRSEMVVFERA